MDEFAKDYAKTAKELAEHASGKVKQNLLFSGFTTASDDIFGKGNTLNYLNSGLNYLNTLGDQNISKNKDVRNVDKGLNLVNQAFSTIADNKENIIKGLGKLGINAGGFVSKLGNVGSPLSGVANMGGKALGKLVAGKNVRQGTGTAIANGVAGVVSMINPVIGAALSFISNASLGQKRTITVHDFSNEYANPYSGTADYVSRAAQLSGTKGGTFDFGYRKRSNNKLRKARRMQNTALTNVAEASNMALSENANLQEMQNSYLYSGSQPQLQLAKSGMKFPELDEIRNMMEIWNVKKLQNGGTIAKNVIPTGALHKNKHHIEETRPELEGQITEKGIPVVSSDVSENITQFAEVESGEITFTKSVTEQLEDFYNNYKENPSDELAIELGKFLVEQILHNTIDKDNVIKKTV